MAHLPKQLSYMGHKFYNKGVAMKIRAAVVRAINQLTIEEVLLDPPKPHRLIVRIHTTGVCYSGLHTYKGELRTTPC